MIKSEREQLIDWLSLFSLSKGEEFTLSSGQKSDTYVDIKKVALHRQASKLLAKLLYEKMMEKFTAVEGVAGVVLGGCHLASIVSMHHPLGLDVVYVRKEAKEHGTKKLIERPYMPLKARIVVIEDVVTTGTSAVNAAKLLQKENLDVQGILAVVDRRAEKTPHLNEEFEFSALIDFEELYKG